MGPQFRVFKSKAKALFDAFVSGPQILAFLPACVLAGFWIGGEVLLLIMSLGFPLILLTTVLMQSTSRAEEFDGPSPTARTEFVGRLDTALKLAHRKSRKTLCLVVELDDFNDIKDRHGMAAVEEAMTQTNNRLQSALRTRDDVFRLDEKRIGVCIAPIGHLNLEVCLQLAARLQKAIERPVSLGPLTVYISASIGLCNDMYVGAGRGKDIMYAAERALMDARNNGPSAIRTYSAKMGDITVCPHSMSGEIDRALERGEIQAWFQPQISTDTGLITGFEALARWKHPERGMITPADFLPCIQQSGKMEQLGGAMLFNALTALKSWDELDLKVPHIGVNFSPDELRNPRLVDQIQWELDRFDLRPDRLAIEILETVVATSPDDTICRNISGLSELGCYIDLDDFGTGHASISSIRRFAIQRLKIDRSFVTKVDQDQDQQRMVSAILLMAERLELDTIAEGVETAGEHAMLAQLGCGHVQGFGIGRPMPFEKTQAWIGNHLRKLSDPPVIGRKTG